MASEASATARVRLFVALEITDVLRQKLAAVEKEPWTATTAMRWVPPEQFHVTLKFIGAVPRESVEAIATTLKPVRTEGPVELHFRGLGFQGGAKGSGVFWVAIEPSTPLEKLASEINRALESLGIAKETRPYRPHVTLARYKNYGSSRQNAHQIRDNVVRDADFSQRDFGSVTAGEFQLMESKTYAAGPIYYKIESFRFAPVVQI